VGRFLAILLGRFGMSVDEAIRHILNISSKIYSPQISSFRRTMSVVKGKDLFSSETLREFANTLQMKYFERKQVPFQEIGDVKCKTFVLSIKRQNDVVESLTAIIGL
jgi:hypothetical protein